jgi:hypothetical protein
MVLQKSLHLLERLFIALERVKAVTRPEEGRFGNGMGRILLVDLVKKLMRLLIGLLP